MHTSRPLLERLREPGNGPAWARFAALYAPFLCFWAQRIGVQDADISELVRAVMAQAELQLSEFDYDQKQSFRGWLRMLTLNKWREWHHSRALLANSDHDKWLDTVAIDESHAVWDEEYHKCLIANALQVMQADFEPGIWQACWETVVEKRPVAEVARDLGLTMAAVYVAKSKVLKRMRLELAGLWS